MKISLKIFVFTYLIMMVITVAGGFMLVNSMYENSMQQEIDTAKETNEIVYIYLLNNSQVPQDNFTVIERTNFIDRLSQNGEEIYVVGTDELEKSEFNYSMFMFIDGHCSVFMVNRHDKINVCVMSKCFDDYIVNFRDVSVIINQRNNNLKLYKKSIVIASVFIAVIMYVFSWYITKPITHLTTMAEKIAAGDYGIRIDTSYGRMKSDEAVRLAITLNELAQNTLEHIEKLSDEARKKEDFMGNFTHEIKTPLTSIIGYADMIRTYDLKPEKRRDYGNYIYNEGKRLEQLALNLLQLLVMDKTDFEMQNIRTDILMNRIKGASRFLGEKYGVEIVFSCEKAEIKAEHALLMTAVLNLIDNACKASEKGSKVSVTGKCMGNEFVFVVSDHGRGIPYEEIEKITEPFYMVDKSRARKQGGAGLGLALCKRIAELHNGEIRITSNEGVGTNVLLILKQKEINPLEEIADEKMD